MCGIDISDVAVTIVDPSAPSLQIAVMCLHFLVSSNALGDKEWVSNRAGFPAFNC